MAEKEDTPGHTPTEQVSWRLPTRIASDNRGDWTPLKEHLESWVEDGAPLDVEPPDATKNVCLYMPAHVVRALERKAAQLSKAHGKRYTPGLVARLVWDLYEPAG